MPTTEELCEPLINPIQAAELLKIHPKTLQRLARECKVPAYRIGTLWRFRRSDLNKWLAENEKAAR